MNREFEGLWFNPRGSTLASTTETSLLSRVEAQALYRQLGGKKIICVGGVFDLTFELSQYFRKYTKNNNIP